MPEIVDDGYWDRQRDELGMILEELQPLYYVYCIGDCSTSGVGADRFWNYPSQLQEFLGRKYRVVNLGRTMLRMETLQTFTEVFEEKIKNGGFVCVWCGSNDIYWGVLAETVGAWLSEFCRRLRNRGLIVIVMTMLPRTAIGFGSDLIPEKIEADRIIFNNWLNENYPEFADAIIDFSDSSEIGYPGAEKDVKYYREDNNTHLNNLGYEIVAGMVHKKIKELAKPIAKECI